METKKISELTSLVTPANDDVLPIVDTSETDTKKITAQNLQTYAQGTLPTRMTTTEGEIDTLQAQNNGWIQFPTTLAYSSVDSPTGVVTTGADTRGYLEQGDKIKYDQTHSLTAYWNLDSNSNSQVGSFNGTDTAITYGTGKFGNCAIFNGTTSKIVLTDTALLKPTGAFTIGCWFKSNSVSEQAIFSSYSRNANSAGFFVEVNGAGKLVLQTANNTAAGNLTNTIGTTNICDNSWHYIVCTYNNNYGQVYVDGRSEGNAYTLTPAYAATNYVRIGCLNLTGTDILPVNGSIDDVMFINGYALSEEWIRAKYISDTAQGSGSFAATKTAFVSSDPTSNNLTLYHGTDSMLINSTISNIYYSKAKKPYGFNVNPNKWTVFYLTNVTTSQSTPAISTWYNLGGYLDIPIGEWRVEYAVLSDVQIASAQQLYIKATLSNANNSETDNSTASASIGTPLTRLLFTLQKSFPLTATTKTRKYLNLFTGTDGCSVISAVGTIQPIIIRATSSYL
jgi:hypothetical protein